MDKKQTITTERKIGKITYLVQALPSEKATDTIHKKIEKLIGCRVKRQPIQSIKRLRNSLVAE